MSFVDLVTSRPSIHAAVVAGSSLGAKLEPTALSAFDLLVAVDAGADALEQAGLVPALFVGDMDSVTPQTQTALESRGVEVVHLPTAKDETDLEAALRLLVDRGVGDITVYGALGGPRLDHMLGNVMLLAAPWLAGTAVRLVDEAHQVCLVGGHAELSAEPGDLVSLVPLTAEVREVSTEGLLYPLVSETLVRSATRAVSNVMVGGHARVTHGDGILLLIHYLGSQT